MSISKIEIEADARSARFQGADFRLIRDRSLNAFRYGNLFLIFLINNLISIMD